MGNSVLRSGCVPGRPVHPHVYGELNSRFCNPAILAGSSPHVWGTRGCCLNFPTRAGSSPHVWGTHYPRLSVPGIQRFIPTCVGNSPVVCTQFKVQSVHPHMCGELYDPKDRSSLNPGSSPHVWGTLAWKYFQHEFIRFIPTCVGNSTG
ncbi:MAG: hypothetical protein PWP14_2096 [Methanolobus sp.]|nr:hypothetical protein [Methanolobus sp.]